MCLIMDLQILHNLKKCGVLNTLVLSDSEEGKSFCMSALHWHTGEMLHSKSCVSPKHTTKVEPGSEAWREAALEEQDGAWRKPVSSAALRFQQNKELS